MSEVSPISLVQADETVSITQSKGTCSSARKGEGNAIRNRSKGSEIKSPAKGRGGSEFHSILSFLSDRQRRKRQEAASREARTLELKRANEAINAGKSDNKKEEYNPFAEVERPVASTSYKPNKVSYHFPSWELS
jgi:hypothetical protein